MSESLHLELECCKCGSNCSAHSTMGFVGRGRWVPYSEPTVDLMSCYGWGWEARMSDGTTRSGVKTDDASGIYYECNGLRFRCIGKLQDHLGGPTDDSVTPEPTGLEMNNVKFLRAICEECFMEDEDLCRFFNKLGMQTR